MTFQKGQQYVEEQEHEERMEDKEQGRNVEDEEGVELLCVENGWGKVRIQVGDVTNS